MRRSLPDFAELGIGKDLAETVLFGFVVAGDQHVFSRGGGLELGLDLG